MAFSRSTKLKLLFDLACFSLRTPSGGWNSTEAEALFQHIVAKGQQDALLGFELGNEVGLVSLPVISSAAVAFHHRPTLAPHYCCSLSTTSESILQPDRMRLSWQLTL